MWAFLEPALLVSNFLDHTVLEWHRRKMLAYQELTNSKDLLHMSDQFLDLYENLASRDDN